jgi:uncharacterized protein (TIGR02147 family)
LGISAAQILEKELRARQKANKNYSLRAFARDIGISPSFLSHLLKGEKSLSPDRAVEIARKIQMAPKEARLLANLSRLQAAKSEESKNLIQQDIDQIQKVYSSFEKLKLDQFSVISDWHHFAILELMDVEGFSSNPTWIAKRLYLSVTEVSLALDRMLALKMIEIRPNGDFKKLKNNAVKDAPSEAIRKFHLQHLKNAAQAIEKRNYDERHTSGITMAIDPQKLPQAEKMIQEFRAKMSAFLEGGKKKNVYHLAVQLFPLDNGGLQ